MEERVVERRLVSPAAVSVHQDGASSPQPSPPAAGREGEDAHVLVPVGQEGLATT